MTAKSNDGRVRKATVLVYKDGQMKTFKQPISTVVLLVYLFILFIYLLIESLTKTLYNMNKSCKLNYKINVIRKPNEA